MLLQKSWRDFYGQTLITLWTNNPWGSRDISKCEVFDSQVKEQCLLVCESIYSLVWTFPDFCLNFFFGVPKLGSFIFLRCYTFKNSSSRIYSNSSVFRKKNYLCIPKCDPLELKYFSYLQSNYFLMLQYKNN